MIPFWHLLETTHGPTFRTAALEGILSCSIFHRDIQEATHGSLFVALTWTSWEHVEGG